MRALREVCWRCRAYDRAAVKMRGSRAALNFPSTDYSADNFMKVGPHRSAFALLKDILP